MACLVLLHPPAGHADPAGPGTVGALILYDAASDYGWVDELHAMQVANLLGHFPVEWEIAPIEDYVAGEVEDYSVLFYIGGIFDNPLPAAFLSDAMTTERTVCWFGYNLWQIAWDEQGFWDQAFTDRYGFQFAGIDGTGFLEIQYKGQALLKDLSDPDIGATIILDPNRAEVKALAYRPPTETEPEASWPYAVHSGNLWYFADTPFSYASEEDRYLVFCDLIHDIVGIDHAPNHRALIRIEDINPTVALTDLDAISDYLSSRGVPFLFSIIPVYEDSLGVLNGGVPQETRLSSEPAMVNALLRMETSGGQPILHGYTHQYDATPNPYDGLTGDDFEFFLSSWDDVLGETLLLGPVPEDSVAWVNDRIDRGLAELSAAGITPIAWETPHYAASALDYVEFGKRFSLTSGRMLYSSSLGPYFVGQFFPYMIERDIYGQRIMPENLGNVSLEPFYDYPAHSPADIVRAAQKNLVVRDGWAAAYFHPGLDLSYLAQIIDGVTALGYTYTAAPTVISFTDVPSDHWAFHEIMACASAGIVSGYDDGLYHPEIAVTRDQMAVYIARALVSPSGDAAIPDPAPPPSFSDVPSTHWAYKHIEYAVSHSVVQGYEDGAYQPGVTTDRGQMAVYIARAMVAPGGDAAIPDPVPPATFPDVPDTFWSYKQVEYCAGQGVVNGYDDSLYYPEIVVTRDQMAVYVARAFDLPR